MTKITDYSIVILAKLATIGEGFHQSRVLAAETRLPAPTVSKILKTLSRSGLLESRRGAHGGYALARPANDITLVDVIEAIEGPVAVTECSLPEAVICGESTHCQLHGHWPRINRAVRNALSSVTLADVYRPVSASHGAPGSPQEQEQRAS